MGLQNALVKVCVAGFMGAVVLGCTEVDTAKAQAEIQAEGQDVINEAATKATVDLIQGKDLNEVKKGVKENAKNAAKQKAVNKAKQIDRNVTGGVGSAILDAQK
ncbi:hypothetical protein LS71_003465 [Helicobacter jaachi]|uniref:Uncharacterized protein n=1 Tax=Helicobacter jaachi TaxID=1677920 RepID=A0A4U8TCU8_9HELI|nr:hypothetical protein [Helicobacter jaachi]TLD97800.1 hypothetical protein LS71_003465 [Helicobacter jaachi]